MYMVVVRLRAPANLAALPTAAVLGDLVWTCVRPDDGVEHVWAAVEGGIGSLVLFVAAVDQLSAVGQARRVCGRAVDVSPVLSGWSLL